jgi:hypothetical protein
LTTSQIPRPLELQLAKCSDWLEVAGLGAYTADTALLAEEDLGEVCALVDKSAEIQAGYSKCNDEDSKRKIAMEYHTSMRSFHEVAFCSAGVKEKWKGLLKGGLLVFSLAEVQALWSTKQFLFSHIEDTRMFQEAQPYHSKLLSKGQRFEIYMQAFRVIDKAMSLQDAKVLYLAMDKKSEAGWDSVRAMFAAFSEGGSSYYVGRSLKGGFWRYWEALGAARAHSEGRIYMAMQSRQ